MIKDPNEGGPIISIIYKQECGLIIATFDGLIKNYESMEFKLVWDHSENQLEFVDRTTFTVCAYSEKLGYLCLGGVEGKL